MQAALPNSRKKGVSDGAPFPSDGVRLAEAWRTFVASGRLDRGAVRPEIARSWIRCRQTGVNPWSNAFPSVDESLLAEKREAHREMSEASLPMMQFLAALLDCSVSLMDGENFVYEFISLNDYYPHNLGTYVLEKEMGTGNATIVAYEMAPVRVDGYEHYRVCSRVFSGVSVPLIDAEGVFQGALNANDSAGRLPAWALDAVVCAVNIIQSIGCDPVRRRLALASGEWFASVIECSSDPVAVLDASGCIICVNSAMAPFVEGFDAYSVGSQPFSAYLQEPSAPHGGRAGSGMFSVDGSVAFLSKAGVAAGRMGVACSNEIVMPNGATYRVVRLGASPGRMRPVDPRIALDIGVGEDPAWRKVDTLVRKVAPVRANVLILGETGSGKEVVARALHRLSGRKGNFVAINCGAIPRDLFAAELFGYERGAFTGARESGAAGKVEAADGGTLFLDEIGEMPMDLQVSLLRVIQSHCVVRLGSNTVRPLDVRFVAATNADVAELVSSGRFRADLYYRLSMVEVTVPPLRQRPSDIALLAEYFNRVVCDELGFSAAPLPGEVVGALCRYSWPGNVRELRNAVERLLIMEDGPQHARVSALPAHIAGGYDGVSANLTDAQGHPECGVETFRASRRPVRYRRWSYEEKLACARMRVDDGAPLSLVCERFGADASQVSRWAKAYAQHGAESLRPSR